MHMLFAGEQIDACDGQYDQKQKDSRRGGVGRITAAVPVEHVVDVAHDSVHLRRVQVGAEQGHHVAVGFERSDKPCDDQIEHHGGDHRQRDLPESPPSGSAVHFGGLVIILVDGGEGACQNQDFEGHDHPDRIKAEHKHFRPVGARDKVHRLPAEETDDQVDKTVAVGRFLKQNHEHKPHRQRVGHIGQKIYGLKELPECPDGMKAHGDQDGDRGGQRHGDDHEQKCVFESLQKVGIMEHIGVVVQADAEVGLRRRVITLLKGVDKDVDQRVHHEGPQKKERRQQIEPALYIAA